MPVLLGSEEALFGGVESLDGVEVRGTLDGHFEKAERRTALVGKGSLGKISWKVPTRR